MGWEKEKIIILIMSTPENSRKYGHIICTAGITENDEWRRLWSITPHLKKKYKINRWDVIEVNTQITPNHRIETRKIDETSIKNIGSIPKKEHLTIIRRIADRSLDNFINNNRSIGILKPKIERLKLIPSTSKNDKSFGAFFPKYHFRCEIPCSVCSKQYKYHTMKCRDWGSNILCRKVKNNPDSRRIVIQKLFYNMKFMHETYLGIGTHRRWQTWMIVGLFWFKK